MDLGSGIRDPGSGKYLFRIPDPGVKKAPDPGSRIRIRNTGCSYRRLYWRMIRTLFLESMRVSRYAQRSISGLTSSISLLPRFSRFRLGRLRIPSGIWSSSNRCFQRYFEPQTSAVIWLFWIGLSPSESWHKKGFFTLFSSSNLSKKKTFLVSLWFRIGAHFCRADLSVILIAVCNEWRPLSGAVQTSKKRSEGLPSGRQVC